MKETSPRITHPEPLARVFVLRNRVSGCYFTRSHRSGLTGFYAASIDAADRVDLVTAAVAAATYANVSRILIP